MAAVSADAPIVQISPDQPEPRLIAYAAGIVGRGGIVASPTDTVYGLLCDPTNDRAVRRIYEVKGRDFSRPLILLIAAPSDAGAYAAAMPDAAQRAVERYWPGPLTVVLPAGPGVPRSLLAGGDTIGLRMPAHPVVLGLIRAAGGALASTSANRSGAPSATTATEVAMALNGDVDLVIDAGTAPLGVESTIVEFAGNPRLVREGSIRRVDVERLLGRLS